MHGRWWAVAAVVAKRANPAAVGVARQVLVDRVQDVLVAWVARVEAPALLLVKAVLVAHALALLVAGRESFFCASCSH